ncbi:MAG TPA: DNA primase, partial [Thermomicrobiales bacterium]|nr:DNA primase [Thermomicrobiales bacterium]
MAERGDIAEIRERVDIVELVGARVQLKRSGKQWKGSCPFHQEKTPSFYVYPESGNFVCYGCGEKGDAFAWLMKTEGVDFPEAVAQLAARTGVEVRRGAAKDPRRDELHERLYALNAAAATFYANVLLSAPAGEPGRRYVAERGLTRETVERFGLGFAPDAWEALLDHLTARGHTAEQLAEAGLVTARDSGGHYDRFRGRLLFPIRNRQGQIVGFGGRALGDAKPKYLNTPQTPIFDKSAILYGIDLAADAIRKSDVAVIVEGYVDAIMAHQVGHANVVASMGTALTEPQVGLLKNLTKRIILALDSDAAGQMATLRGIETMRGALDYDTVAVPDPQQLIRFERRLKDTEILVLTLPEGKDPDEFLRARPDDWPALVAGAEPLLDYYVRAVATPVDLADPRAKSAAVHQVAPLIRELPDDIQRHHYTGLLARLLRLPEDAVASEIRRLMLTRRGREAREPEAAAERPRRAEVSREAHLIGLLLAYPDVAHDLAGEVADDDFLDTTHRLLWAALRDAAAADPRLKSRDFLDALPDDTLRDAAEGVLTALGARPEQFPGPLRQEARDTLRLLRQERYDAQRLQLQAAITDASRAGDAAALGALAAQMMALVAAGRAFDPALSPYF